MIQAARAKEMPGGGGGDARGHGKRGAGTSSGATVRLHRKMTPEERTAAQRFLRAACEEVQRYIAMTEEEYRLAGKLHKYDPDTEWMKRYARVARMYPPPSFMAPNLGEYMMYLEEDEQDYAIGLAGCVGMLEEDDSGIDSHACSEIKQD
jgi:hypothetical protein